jgi:hypothetical protein
MLSKRCRNITTQPCRPMCKQRCRQHQGKLSSVQKNDNAACLPSSAESTKVDSQSQQFQKIR